MGNSRRYLGEWSPQEVPWVLNVLPLKNNKGPLVGTLVVVLCLWNCAFVMLLPLGTKALPQSNSVLCTPFSGTHLPSLLGNFSPLGLLVLGLLIPIGEIRPIIEDAEQRYNISLPCNLRGVLLRSVPCVSVWHTKSDFFPLYIYIKLSYSPWAVWH